MYRVYSDDTLIYDHRLDYLNLYNTNLALELNKTGAFTFSATPPVIDHPHYLEQKNAWDSLVKMKSIIRVFQDGELIFRGRIINEEIGFYNEKQVTCEGELAYLLDSIIRPYGTEETPWSGTPEQYLNYLLNGTGDNDNPQLPGHNVQVDTWKRFKVGTVTVTDGDTSNQDNIIYRSDSDYKSAWELITTKLIDPLGGYLVARHEADGIYLDYLAELNVLSNQSKITFGKNMLDLKQAIKGEDIMSAIIPIGAEGLTIKDVNDNVDYLYDQAAVNEYGWIFKTVKWDNVTDPTTLKNKAQEYLTSAKLFNSSIEITAADLSGITDVNPFRLGKKVIIQDDKHEYPTDDLVFLIEKISIDINNQANNKLVVNKTVKTFTESTLSAENKQKGIIEQVSKIETNIAGAVTKDELDKEVAQVTEQTSSAINQTSEQIMTEVSKDYYLKDSADKLVESVNTKFTQTESEFELRFNSFAQDLDALENGTDAQFNDIKKYIRFVDGDIVLGESGNKLTLKIENDRIAFLESGAEVAYFSNRKLYVLDGEFLNSLKLGNFAFMPRANGNVSFKKVN